MADALRRGRALDHAADRAPLPGDAPGVRPGTRVSRCSSGRSLDHRGVRRVALRFGCRSSVTGSAAARPPMPGPGEHRPERTSTLSPSPYWVLTGGLAPRKRKCAWRSDGPSRRGSRTAWEPGPDGWHRGAVGRGRGGDRGEIRQDVGDGAARKAAPRRKHRCTVAFRSGNRRVPVDVEDGPGVVESGADRHSPLRRDGRNG